MNFLFESTEFENNLRETILDLWDQNVDIDAEYINYLSIDSSNQQKVEDFIEEYVFDYMPSFTFKSDQLVKIFFRGSQDNDETTLGDLVTNYLMSKKATLLENKVLKIDSKTFYFSVMPDSGHSILSDSEDYNEFETTMTYLESKINIRLFSDLNPITYFLHTNKIYEDYLPVHDNEDLFIQITSEAGLPNSLIQEIIESYFFELNCATGITLNVYDRFNIDFSFEESEKNQVILRPLISGKGVNETINLYNNVTKNYDSNSQIIGYSKIIEYVSQTVLRKELVRTVSNKLSTNSALTPDAEFILELQDLYSENNNNQKEEKLFEVTITECCDLLYLKKYAPEFLGLSKITGNNAQENKTNFKEIANSVSATRNMVAHAKPNYKKRGTECPEDQLEDFTYFMRIIAQQVIRWFARQEETTRITI